MINRHIAIVGSLITAMCANGCATLPSDTQLSQAERHAICTMHSEAVWPFIDYEGYELTREEEESLRNSVPASEWVATPSRIRCADGVKRLHLPRNQLGSHWDSYWISRDGGRAAISGSWIGGPALGSGGQCLFERRGEEWVRDVCIPTFSI